MVDGETGVIVPFNLDYRTETKEAVREQNAQALAEAIKRMLDLSSGQRRQMGETGSRKMPNLFPLLARHPPGPCASGQQCFVFGQHRPSAKLLGLPCPFLKIFGQVAESLRLRFEF